MLPAYVGLERALSLMLTAQRFGADEALEWRLVSGVVPRDDLHDRVGALAELVLRAPRLPGACTRRRPTASGRPRPRAVAAAASEAEKLEGFRSFAE